jgi:RNA recognition motif-containing protein
MENKKLYVGNLSYSVTNKQLEDLFTKYGEVTDTKVIDGKGFGFVEMATSDEAEKAKEGLNDTEFEGRTIKVDEARPPRPRQNGGSRRF